MSRLSALLTAITLLLVGSIDPAGATEASQTIEVGPFHKLRVEGNAEITLRAGDAESVTVRGAEYQSRDVRVDVEVQNGELRIRTRPHGGSWWSDMLEPGHTSPRVTVVFRSLDAVELAGAVRLRADALRVPRLAITAAGAVSIQVADLRSDEFRLHGAGAMKARLAGRVGSQEITLSGAGKYDAPELVSDDAQVDVSGAGKVLIRAEKTLRVSVAGAGAVDYLGDPKITRDINGAGRLRPHKVSAGQDPPPVARFTATTRPRESYPA